MGTSKSRDGNKFSLHQPHSTFSNELVLVSVFVSILNFHSRVSAPPKEGSSI